MDEKKIKLIVGALLHDVGKVVYRQGDDKRKHSRSGYDYLREKAEVNDSEILEYVLYHHADAIKDAGLDAQSLAYIVYIADNIASAADRRAKMEEEQGFEIHTALQPVFNLLNGSHAEQYYRAHTLDPKDGVNYPTTEKSMFDESRYRDILLQITDNLRGIKYTEDYVNSLLEILEANLSFVPSSTSKHEVADISLFDHVKLTAACASCIYEYMNENGIADYREELYSHAAEFYGKQVFLLASMDVSGIQKFIYTISTDNALKTLRSRSFYLEIMMEHMIDMLMERLELSRANLIYSGGGHCYMLLPNTERTIRIFDEFLRDINGWYEENFQIALYIAGGYVPCSCEELHNTPSGSYGELFRKMSRMISERKSHRYNADEIRTFNNRKEKQYDRECKVCRRIGAVSANGRCKLCESIEAFSKDILSKRTEFFSIVRQEEEGSLPLPGGSFLVADNESDLRARMDGSRDNFVRAYGKNRMYTGKYIATKLWVGDYSSRSSFEELAKEADGIDRIGVLRADVDSLGHTFVAGFDDPENDNRYVTLSRTATLSRQLSLFFKLYINEILSHPQFTLSGEKKQKREATIVYSGGDDLFIVGAWNDVIELAVDIRRGLARYTENTLTISAGIGIYRHDYPISVMADEVASQEDRSKKLSGKNALTLFEDGMCHMETDSEDEDEKEISDGTYHWDEFENEVIGEKFVLIRDFLDGCDEKGMSLMYRMLELIRGNMERINFARMVYLIARLEPEHDAPPEKKEKYREFSKQMYKWISGEDDEQKKRNCRQLKTAMQIYAYLHRETDKEEASGDAEKRDK